jgi:hypothetical protein
MPPPRPCFTRFSQLGLTLFTAAAAGCVSVPEGAFDRKEQGRAELTVADYAGQPVDPLDAPRMPRLRAALAESPDEDDIAWLFRGPADSELLGDLERAPLLSAQRERAVPCALSFTHHGLELLPHAALAPGEYVFAVAAWAIDRDAPLALDIVVSAGPGGGASMIAAWPADGSISVGTDLPSAWLAFDGELENATHGVWLEGPDGLAIDAEVHAGSCEALGIAVNAATCVALAPHSWLAPLSAHRLVVGSATRDAHDAPVGPLSVSFRTGSGPDARAPAPAAIGCAIDETPFELGCALISDRSIALRIAASEPFAIDVEAGERRWSALAPSAETALAIDALPPGAALDVSFELKDSTGNTLQHSERFETYEDLPALSITEVLANPLGPEPQQERVELWNFGDAPIALAGMQLSDQVAEPGVALATPVVLDPGARVLLVADAFDASDGSDVPIPPGTPLIRVGKAIGSAGLANRGEPLFLRDAQGRRVSAAPSTPAPSAGTCIARISEDPRDGSASAFAADEATRCTPGR